MQRELTYAIAPAGPADAAALARVHVDSWRETYAGILPRPYLDRMSVALHERHWRHRLAATREVTLAAEGHNGLVGYVSAQRSRRRGPPGEAEIATLYVLRAAQGVGLGRALFTAAARVMAARGANALILWVLRDNERARGFYERLDGRLDFASEEYVGGAVAPSVRYRWGDLKGWLVA
ncbi:MAG TPA: GNAT family N-acetyltransferase [Caulobacteraceae bacterium]|nr:GNAT family N-acetyltransferase [Caulobacteraceae bacterium]